MSDFFGKLRTIALVVMIVFAFILEVILLYAQQWWWAGFWGIFVIGGTAVTEILSYVTGKKTISTRWKEWAESSPFWAYTALLCMGIAFFGLLVHLAVWGGMIK